MARVGEETMCTTEPMDLADLAELEQRGISLERVLAPATHLAS